MNYARDFANNTDLSLAGWRVIRIWECEIKTKSRREETLEKLYRTIVNYDGSAHLGKIKNMPPEKIPSPQEISPYADYYSEDTSIAAEPDSDYY